MVCCFGFVLVGFFVLGCWVGFGVVVWIGIWWFVVCLLVWMFCGGFVLVVVFDV